MSTLNMTTLNEYPKYDHPIYEYPKYDHPIYEYPKYDHPKWVP